MKQNEAKGKSGLERGSELENGCALKTEGELKTGGVLKTESELKGGSKLYEGFTRSCLIGMINTYERTAI